ncbi:MAG: methyltransferase protein [Ferruginibacter sp.]|nr:methyltransferase protein [Ferruginibacter sp.]
MDNSLDKDYWNKRYEDQQTGWDIGAVSAPLKAYIDQLEDKSIAILIPGCGNAYEAGYLLQQGFTNVTLVDISPVLVEDLSSKMSAHLGKGLTIICDDFFNMTSLFDLILEQTFFCALEPSLRKYYVDKAYANLNIGGKLVGVLFDRDFDGGPPFGGSKEAYQDLFSPLFDILTMEPCYNSIEPRKETELFVILKRKQI